MHTFLQAKTSIIYLCLVLCLLWLRDRFKDKGASCPGNIAANNCEMPEDYISELGGRN